MYQEVYAFGFKRKSHQSIGMVKIKLYLFYHGRCVQNLINLVVHFTFYLCRVVLSFMIVVVLCWQQLVQTVQGEFWVRATQETQGTSQ